MKQIGVLVLVLAALGLVWGCGDDDDGPTGNGPTEPTRLVVNSTAGAPSVSNPNSSVWNSVDSITLSVSATRTFAPKPSGEATLPANITIQAIANAGDLYLRLQWADPSLNAYYGHFYIVDTFPPIDFDVQSLEPFETADLEDQLLVMFADTGSIWDVWNWRVLRTGAAGLAKGINIDWSDSTATLDAAGTAGIEPAVLNSPDQFGLPMYLPEDTSEFSGYVFLYDDRVAITDTVRVQIDTVIFGGTPPDTLIDTNYVTYVYTTGWEMGQRIPRYMIDTSAASATAAERGSLWDIHAGQVHDGTGYTVVLTRPLTTGFDDDIAMGTVDSVQVKVAVYDNDYRYFQAPSQNLGFTNTFWLVF